MQRRLAMVVASAAAMSRSVVLVRHGLSKMNVALARQPWGTPNFVDQNIRDAPLEPEGVRGAKALRDVLARDASDVELVVSSPLTRALQTADAAWDVALSTGVPALALPLAAERCYMSSDVGAPASVLVEGVGKRFAFRDDEFPDDRWWYGAVPGDDAYGPVPEDDWRPTGSYVSPGEPIEAFRERMAALVDWLNARDEATIGLTCHWAVLMALTGRSFENCQALRLPLEELYVRTDREY